MKLSFPLFCIALSILSPGCETFSVRPNHNIVIMTPSPSTGAGAGATTSTTALLSTKSGRPRSRVSDPSGPTPDPKAHNMETVNIEDIPEMEYDEDAHPIPHQPWRRGITDGCEDPIDAEWRQQAEDLIYKSIKLVGGKCQGVTWYLTQVIVFIDDDWEKIPKDYMLSNSPTVYVDVPTGPVYKPPEDPEPDDIYADDEANPVYDRDDSMDKEMKSKMYARAEEGEEDLGLDEREDDIPSLYANQETRGDQALRVAEEMQLYEETREHVWGPEEELQGIEIEKKKKGQKKKKKKGTGRGQINTSYYTTDRKALAKIGGAVLDALETMEDELNVLERHEVVLSSLSKRPGILETQKQFDRHRGDDVAVYTEDPWESNRTLRGKLVDRNSMDVIINQKGRMVTIPLNFVRCVKLKYLPPPDVPDESEMLP